MYTFDAIRDAVLMMQAEQGPLLRRMQEILIRYDGDWVIPMPELANEPKIPQLTPALVGEAIDQIAMRAASVQPLVFSPPIDPRKERGTRSREYSTTRGQIITATLEKSRWNLGRRRYYRQLTAYHTSSLVVVPDMKAGLPRIEVRDPLGSFIEPMSGENLRDPLYGAFVKRLSGTALRASYPKVQAERGGPISNREVQRMWEVVEWYDQEDFVVGLMGPIDGYGSHLANNSGTSWGPPLFMELERLPNRAQCLPVVVPHNVSLAGIASRIGALLGNVDLQAKLMALHITAQEKAIFPDTYVIGRQNSGPPSLVMGEWQDGRTGNVNLITDAEAVGVLRTSPDPATGQMIDRLERNFRTSTSLVPQLGGETYGAMRTGRAIDALSGMALDPRVQEVHEITEAYLPTLFSAILATYKGYWPSKSYSMYCGRANNRKLVEFVPTTHIETLETGCSYFTAGADVMQLTQILGSLRGAEAISQLTFQEQHPMIGDAAVERSQLHEEALVTAVMQGIQQQIMSGKMSPTIAARFYKHMKNNKSVFEAVELVDEELRKIQATQAPPAPEGMVAPPQSMPGMTGGPAADQQPAAFQQGTPPPQGVAGMRQLMQTMGA